MQLAPRRVVVVARVGHARVLMGVLELVATPRAIATVEGGHGVAGRVGHWVTVAIASGEHRRRQGVVGHARG